MNIDNERYEVSIEFSIKPKIPIEKVKKIFGLDSLTGPGYLKPASHRKGVYFKMHKGTLWVTVAEDKPSWVKAYNMIYDNILNLIKKIEKLPTEILIIVVYEAKTTRKLVLARSSSHWEINNGYRGAILEGGTELSRSKIDEMLKNYISET